MILGQISYLDCLAFVLFLAPQLLLQVGLFETLKCGLQTLPFLLVQMPYGLVRERYFTARSDQSPFVQQSTLFQDLVIRCVRYAFARIPASIGKVFFSKPVALPFFVFRRLRHGIVRTPIHWEEVIMPGLKGIWIIDDPTEEPDIVVYYCHGGGFSMGSSYFYLEFLLAWVSILREMGYKNPALFALEYTLVPMATYPTQLEEAQAGYGYVLGRISDSSRVVVAGDSAGGTLAISLLLSLSENSKYARRPGLATLISPWTTILSPKNHNTTSDYLDADALGLYGRQYLGNKAKPDNPIASPGTCKDLDWWKRASPEKGWLVVYGAEEVFAPEAKDMVKVLSESGVHVEEHEEPGWIHAWPVVKLFLCDSQEDRQSGLRRIVKTIKARIPPRTIKKS